jgi:hypothetical protein
MCHGDLNVVCRRILSGAPTEVLSQLQVRYSAVYNVRGWMK